MFRKPEKKKDADKTKNEKPEYLKNLDYFNYMKAIKVIVGVICLVFNVILTGAFMLMMNPIFLLFAGSMYICGRYLRLVWIEEWLIY